MLLIFILLFIIILFIYKYTGGKEIIIMSFKMPKDIKKVKNNIKRLLEDKWDKIIKCSETEILNYFDLFVEIHNYYKSKSFRIDYNKIKVVKTTRTYNSIKFNYDYGILEKYCRIIMNNSNISGKNIVLFSLAEYNLNYNKEFLFISNLTNIFKILKKKYNKFYNEIIKIHDYLKSISKYEIDEDNSIFEIIQYIGNEGIKSHFDSFGSKYGDIYSINIGNPYYYVFIPILAETNNIDVIKVEKGEIGMMSGKYRINYSHCIPDNQPNFKGKYSILFKYSFKFANDNQYFRSSLDYYKNKFIKYFLFKNSPIENNTNIKFNLDVNYNYPKKIFIGDELPDHIDFDKYYYYSTQNNVLMPEINKINNLKPIKDFKKFKIKIIDFMNNYLVNLGEKYIYIKDGCKTYGVKIMDYSFSDNLDKLLDKKNIEEIYKKYLDIFISNWNKKYYIDYCHYETDIIPIKLLLHILPNTLISYNEKFNFDPEIYHHFRPHYISDTKNIL